MRVPLIKVEDRPVGCTLLIADPKSLDYSLPHKSIVEAPELSALDELDALFKYYDVHDEQQFAFCFDYDGILRSIRRLYNPDAGPGPNLLAWLTRSGDAYAFQALKWQRSFRVYSSGELDLVGTLSEIVGKWELRSLPKAEVAALSQETSIGAQLIWQIIDLAIELTHLGYGALILLGDPDDRLSRDPSRLTVSKVPIRLVGRHEFINIAKQDGALLVSSQGEFVDATFMLRPSGQVPQKFAGRGRHATAFLVSTEQPQLVVIAVSQNRSITLFKDGKFIEM